MRISDWSSDVCSSDLSRMPRSATPSVLAGQMSMIASKIAQPATTRSARSWPMHGRPERSASDMRDSIVLTSRIESDRKSVVSGKRVSGCVDLGGRRIIKKKKDIETYDNNHNIL